MKKLHLRILAISLCLLLILPAFSFLPIAAADTDSLEQELYPLGGLPDESMDGYTIVEGNTILRSSMSALPESVDNSQLVQTGQTDREYFPPIRKQVGGSCTSYASTYYAFTYEVNKYKHEVLGLPSSQYDASIESNQYSPKFTYSLANNWKKEGSSYSNNYNILQTYGSLTWADFPYTDHRELSNNSALKRQALEYRVDKRYFTSLDTAQNSITGPNDPDLTFAKTLLNEGRVLNVTMYSFRGSQYKETRDNRGKAITCVALNESVHALTIVGYDDTIECDMNGDGIIEEAETGAFKIANSHGIEYHNNGYVWIMYDALNMVSQVSGDGSWQNIPKNGQRQAAFSQDEFLSANDFRYITVAKKDVNLVAEATVFFDTQNDGTPNLFSGISKSYTGAFNPSTSASASAVQYKWSKLYAGNFPKGSPMTYTFLIDYSDYIPDLDVIINDSKRLYLEHSTNISIPNVYTGGLKFTDNLGNCIGSTPVDRTYGYVDSMYPRTTYSVDIHLTRGDLNYDGVVDEEDNALLRSHVTNGTPLSNLQKYLSNIEVDDIQYELLSDTTVAIGDGVNPAIATDHMGGIDIPSSIQLGSNWYNVTSIAPNAFKDCQISGIDLDNGYLKSIGEFAFSGCDNLTTVTIPRTISSIADGAFAGNNGIANIFCPQNDADYYGRDGVLYRRQSSDSHKLVAYPAGRTLSHFIVDVDSVGSRAFAGNTHLQNVLIPESAFTAPFADISIASDAFADCPNLTLTVYSGSSAHSHALQNGIAVSVIPSNIFYRGAIAYKLSSAGTAMVNHTFSPELVSGSVTIPQTITRDDRSYTVTSVGANALRDCDALRVVSLPATVTDIGIAAFYGSGLTSISIPAAVTNIGSHAFHDCASLTAVSFVDDGDLQTIGLSAFHGCDSLLEAALPRNLRSIGDYVFAHCTSLRSATLDSDLLTAVPAYAFYGCTALEEVDTSINLRTIGDHAFTKCASLTGINLHSATDIGAAAFHSSGLTSISIPRTVGTMGDNVFNNCAALETVTFDPDAALTAVGHRAFYSCISLREVHLPDSVTSIGSFAFGHCAALEEITLPANLTAIPYYGFYGCSSLTEIDIPALVVSIDDYAFTHCSGLTNVRMPASLTDIGYYAFYGCNSCTFTRY